MRWLAAQHSDGERGDSVVHVDDEADGVVLCCCLVSVDCEAEVVDDGERGLTVLSTSSSSSINDSEGEAVEGSDGESGDSVVVVHVDDEAEA